MVDKKYVSIIIPTYREWGILTNCISALSKQTFPSEMFEVIIVNNDPSDPVPGTLVLPGNYIVIEEEKPGSYAARNAGLKIAKGEIIGFTDSDCIPGKDWIKNAVDHLAKSDTLSRIGGKIDIIQKSSIPTIVEVYNKIYSFPQKAVITNHGGNITANLFTYKYVFEKVGFFDENLLSRGDLEWGSLANKAGFKIDYVESIEVYHPPRNFKELVKKEKRVAGGIVYAYEKKRAGWINIIKFIYSFRPRLIALKHVYSLSKEKRLRWKDIIVIPLIRYYFGVIRSIEILRVLMGKKPNRS